MPLKVYAYGYAPAPEEELVGLSAPAEFTGDLERRQTIFEVTGWTVWVRVAQVFERDWMKFVGPVDIAEARRYVDALRKKGRDVVRLPYGHKPV